jgi:hypothetical protein
MPTPRTQIQEEDDLLISTKTSPEELNLDLQEAQERLLALRRQMEEAERRERELEELRARRNEAIAGHKQMKEKFTRSFTLLEQAEYEAQREMEQIQITKQTFADQLEQLDRINYQEWTPENMEESINRSMTLIDHSRTVYNQSRARVEALSTQSLTSETDFQTDNFTPLTSQTETFMDLVRKGFGLSLPIIITLIALIFVLLSQK